MAHLLSIHSNHNRTNKITPSVLYHHRPLNTMDNDASRRFDLSHQILLALFHSKYSPQSPGSWTMCHLTTEVLSSVISALCKQPYPAATSPTFRLSPYTPIGPPSATTWRSATCLRKISFPLSISLRCMDTGSIMVTNPPDPSSSGQTWLQRRGVLFLIPTFWRAAGILGNPEVPTPRILTST